MKIIRSYEFNTPNPNWPAYDGAPVFFHKDTLYYVYGFDPIFCRKIGPDGTAAESCYPIPKDRTAAFPGKRRVFACQGHAVLSCGNQRPPRPAFPGRVVCDLFLDLDDDMRELALPEDIAARYRCPGTKDETAEVRLSDSVMHYKNSRRYQCLEPDGTVRWEEKHKGYRYTPFEEKNGCVLFGTAGAGGGLYCYRTADGACLCALDTKGTPRYTWFRDRILCCGAAGELLVVDPFCGEIMDRLVCRGHFDSCSSFGTDGTYIFASAFEKKTLSPCVYLIDPAETAE